jgi:hypothetical protein
VIGMTCFTIPLRLPSLANCRMHWRAMLRLKQKQKATTAAVLAWVKLPPLPATVTITRIGPKKLDSDNLAGAAKYVRDQIAAAYGVDDGSDLYSWQYAQQRGDFSVRVEITPLG